MKLIFSNNAEKERVAKIVMDASSASNSKSLMDLVKDSTVDGSEPEPKIQEKVPEVPKQEPMAELIERARVMGIHVSSEDSRAGILAKIKAGESVPESAVEKKEESGLKMYKVLNEEGIQLKDSDETIEMDGEYEADPDSKETKAFLKKGLIEEVV